MYRLSEADLERPVPLYVAKKLKTIDFHCDSCTTYFRHRKTSSGYVLIDSREDDISADDIQRPLVRELFDWLLSRDFVERYCIEEYVRLERVTYYVVIIMYGKWYSVHRSKKTPLEAFYLSIEKFIKVYEYYN